MPFGTSALQKQANVASPLAEGDGPAWLLRRGDTHPPALPADFFVRIVGLRDRGSRRRREWLGQWAPVDDCHEYDGDDCKILSQSRRSFDAILIHGDDCARLARIVRRWRETLANKAIVVLSSQASPATTAALLQAGADNAFNLETSPVEAAAFMAALWRRMNVSVRSAGAALPCEIGGPDRLLTHSEQVIMTALAESPGQMVCYAKLLRRLNKPVSVDSIRSLQVLVSRIRKKCPDTMTIRMLARQGYALDIGQ